MAKLGGRSISPIVLIGGVVILLAVTLGFAIPAFMGAPARRTSHPAATPIVTTPTATDSPSDTPAPTATATASVPVEPGPAPGALGPPPAGAAVPSSSTIVYLNGPTTIQVYSAPDAGKRATSLPGHNSIDQPSAFLVLDQQPGWFHVLLPVAPNGSTGWLKASDVQVASTTDYLRVTVSQFRIDHYVDGKWQAGYRVAVGKPATPTPTGLFYVLASQVVDQAPYTPGIFALSGFAPRPLPGFLGATLGVHGWTDSSVIGTRVSNGCVRLASKDMDPLLRHLILGTPVDIVA
jgi:lipoprotein-anchoring transpeptidase ErfK/SrfK